MNLTYDLLSEFTKNRTYIFSRFLSVSIKPLMLLFCISYQLNDLGYALAMIFLVSSTNMMLFSFPIYRNHHLNYFIKSEWKRKFYSNRYKSEIITFFFISIFFIIPLNVFFKNSLSILICTFFIFAIDKIYDEIQRLLILKKKFDEWAKITLIKNFLLSLFLINKFLDVDIVYYGFIYFILNIFFLISYIRFNFNFKILKLLKRFSKSIWNEKNIIFMNYFFLTFTMGDKIVIGKFYKAYLAEYSLVSNFLSIPLLFITFFFISRYKSEFVNNYILIKDVFFSKVFNSILIFTFIPIIIILTYFKYFNFIHISFDIYIFLLIIFFIRAYDLIVFEVIYWKDFYKKFFLIEFIFFIIFLFCLFLINLNFLNLQNFIFTYLFLSLIRISVRYFIFKFFSR